MDMNATIAARENQASLSVSLMVKPAELRFLLESIHEEKCDHSWVNFDSNGTLSELQNWENQLRSTRIFFYFINNELVGSATIAERVRESFKHAGFPVLGRCYILKRHRGKNLYRKIYEHRVKFCLEQYGDSLRAIHVGTSNSRVSRVLADNRYSKRGHLRKIGNEALDIDGEDKLVGAYLFMLNSYMENIISSIEHDPVKDRFADLHQFLVSDSAVSQDCIASCVIPCEQFISSEMPSVHFPEITELGDLCRSIPVIECTREN